MFAFLDNCGSAVDVNSSINIRFENGVLAALAIGGNCSMNGADMHMIFTHGRIDFDPWLADFMHVWKDTEQIEDPTIDSAETQPVDNLLDAIAGRAEVRAGVEMGIIHSELMDAIYESAQTSQIARPHA